MRIFTFNYNTIVSQWYPILSIELYLFSYPVLLDDCGYKLLLRD